MAPKHIVYKFLCDCGVDDFSIRDVAKPDPTRVRIILSAIINFARFREERMNDCDVLLESSDDVVVKYKEVLDHNNEVQNRMTSLNDELASEGYTMEQVDMRNDELESKLKELRNDQQRLATEHGKYKSDKTGLVKELENQSALYLGTEKDLEQVRPYIKESPESVRELIARMKESLKEEQDKVKDLDTHSKKISVSLDSFQLLIQEFKNLNRTLEEIQTEAAKQDTSGEKLRELQIQAEENEDIIKDYTRNISQVGRQLHHNEERIQKLGLFYSEKLEVLKGKLNAKESLYTSLRTRQYEQEADAASKKLQIELWQRQMSELKRSFEIECKEASFELGKLSSHIQLYELEMTRKIDEQQKQILDSA
ncbi:DEKNAAC102455 [Brettanomyces naardenensis]|uniref:DEKNAAC102455 n=1 Tax=Brettanomyces naardenensis TaxID=13370 RepID=A0A448YKB8_BRENA|nr:DEKNAAC102455 [Brettanomyces naardenensis]